MNELQIAGMTLIVLGIGGLLLGAALQSLGRRLMNR